MTNHYYLNLQFSSPFISRLNKSRSASNQYILNKPLKLSFSLFYQDNRNEIGRAGEVYNMREDPRIPRRDCPPLQSFIAAKSLVYSLAETNTVLALQPLTNTLSFYSL